MITKKIFFLLIIVNIGFLKAQYTAIPDSNFEQALIDLNIDSDNTLNGQVLTSDIEPITVLDIHSYNIQNLSGIENFTNLTQINCSDNSFDFLDFSSNTNLEVILCSDNSFLTEINLNNLINLQYLYLNFDLSLNNLDLSDNVNLKELYLGELYCSGHVYGYYLTNLDLSNNTSLETLICIGIRSLENINLSNCVSLKYLVFRCNGSNINLDISDCRNLEYLNCSDANLNSLNLQNNVNLKHLICGDVSDFGGETNRFSSLDLSHNINLQTLKCQNIFFDFNNPFYELDLSNNPLLVSADLSLNLLNKLNVANGNNNNLTLTLSIPTSYNRLQCIKVDSEEIADIANNDENNWIENDQVVYSADCETNVIADELFKDGIYVYPNPAKNRINIKIPNERLFQVNIYNLLGKKILSTKKKNVDISYFKNGIYIIKITTQKNELITKKIIKIGT